MAASSNSVTYSHHPSSSQKPSSFGSTSSPTTWDVFVSFRGDDTRYNFTSYLYDKLVGYGIRTFMDDPELRIGEVITDALIQAINDSKIYVVVFSENYAFSPWCLDELVEIYKCYENMNRLVIGVYYNINPSVVRHQKESFGKAFEKHETGHFVGKMERVNNWRSTLEKVAGFSGKHISAKRSHADIINEIVDEIILKINPKALDVAKYPIGLDSRVKSITALLSNETDGVTKIGIYGMGGVGKTTLAKALYNQLLLNGFKGISFLANVREISGTTKGLVSLQQQFIDDVLRRKKVVEVSNIEEGTMLIRERTCSKKILVLIDDIDDLKQYESLVGPFASGSVVIITTRDEEILDKIQVKPTHRYWVNELEDGESLALFTKHAFGNAEPDKSLLVLSKDILCLAGGLPLALEVFGSYLCSKPSEAGWKSFIEKLQRVPNSTIKQKLFISLDAIDSDDPMLKKIFLDIACFFVGGNKGKVVAILETYYSYIDHNIDILKKRCLVTINDANELRMHDLLRDVGREIARNNSPDEPEKYSRLWQSVDIWDVLKKQKGTEAIEGIISHNFKYKDESKNVSVPVKTFKMMRKLRFLRLQGIILTGSFKQTFEELRWLRWDCCPFKYLPSEFYPEKLVVLDLCHSKMTTMWKQNKASQAFEHLKTLSMRRSLDLTKTPEFTNLPFLESLNFGGCTSLVEVHKSIGTLVRLVSLNLNNCGKLRSIPEAICNMRALEVLNIGYCRSLESLPIRLGNIKSLKNLDGRSLTISKLPDSIGHLNNLVVLNLSDNDNLQTLPDIICNLRALEVLDIGDCNNLEALPTELGNIESLKQLNVAFLNVSKLPDSIGRLTKLVELNLNGNINLETLPDSICNMRSLEILDISRGRKLVKLPNQPRKMDTSDSNILKKQADIESSKNTSSSTNSDISSSILTGLPSGIGQLMDLTYLRTFMCRNLLAIEEVPPNLKTLDAEHCSSMERLPNLSNSKQLEELRLTCCTSLTEIVGMEGLTSLKILHLVDCKSSLITYTLTKRLFQIYSQLRQEIYIEIAKEEYPEWLSDKNSIGGRIMVLNLPPNLSNNSLFMGIVLCCDIERYPQTYILNNTAGDIIWSGESHGIYHGSMIVIVPRSMFLLKDEDNSIQLTIDYDADIQAIHLLYND